MCGRAGRLTAKNGGVWPGRAVLVWIFKRVQRKYLYTAREVTRLMGMAKTPMYAHFSTVRARPRRLRALGVPRQIDSARCFYMWNATAERSLLTILGLGSCSSRRCRRAGR